MKNYLRQQKLEQTQTQNNNIMNSKEDMTVMTHGHMADNVSTSSSHSNHTNSSKNSKNSKNSITIKNRIKIIRHKTVTAIKNVELPSFGDLLSNEFISVDDEKTTENVTVTY